MRCHACDTRTDGQWKVVQYSVWAESAITTWFITNPYSPTSGRCLLLSKRASFSRSGLPFSSSACPKQGDNLSLLSLFPLQFCHQFPKSDWEKWSLRDYWCHFGVCSAAPCPLFFACLTHIIIATKIWPPPLERSKGKTVFHNPLWPKIICKCYSVGSKGHVPPHSQLGHGKGPLFNQCGGAQEKGEN